MSELSVGQLKGLPINSNVITVPSGNTLYAPGHVVQVQSVTKTDTYTTSATTYSQIPGLSASIVPKYASSKILVIVNIYLAQATASDGLVRLLRDGSAIGNTSFGLDTTMFGHMPYINTTFHASVQSLTFLDSPNKTSAVSYTTEVRAYATGGTTYINRRPNGDFGYTSSITLMEIAA